MCVKADFTYLREVTWSRGPWGGGLVSLHFFALIDMMLFDCQRSFGEGKEDVESGFNYFVFFLNLLLLLVSGTPPS